jgi:Lon protease-like protein
VLENSQMNAGHRRNASSDPSERFLASEKWENNPMHLPLFPLNVVLFPGMMLPLHIFEPRYLEMIDYCVENKSPFGVVLINEGQEVGGVSTPHLIGTMARIAKRKEADDGRLHILAAGTRRFKIESLDRSHAYLSGTVIPLPIANADTRLAHQLTQQLRPELLEYISVLSEASNAKMQLDRLPEDPKLMAYMVAIALQIDNDEKQRLLEMDSVPELLARERHLVSRETLLTRFMAQTQGALQQMGGGPTGYVFPN